MLLQDLSTYSESCAIDRLRVACRLFVVTYHCECAQLTDGVVCVLQVNDNRIAVEEAVGTWSMEADFDANALRYTYAAGSANCSGHLNVGFARLLLDAHLAWWSPQ